MMKGGGPNESGLLYKHLLTSAAAPVDAQRDPLPRSESNTSSQL